MIIGYARVSTQDQNLDMQIKAIEAYAQENGKECKLFAEKESGGKKDRKELERAFDSLREGDVFVIYKLDRLARSTKQLYELSDKLKARGVEFVSLNDSIDTTTAAGRAMFGMLAVFAEFERSIIQERTQAGLKAAKKRGRVGGRPTLKANTKRQIVALFKSGESANDIAKEFNIGRSTVYKVLKEADLEEK
ncbi:recombinase family protein [Priestia sp. JV24]|uniref:recombinase family protein n=1 Tax=Priestia TaxID=2800373 RepID=UPI0021D66DA2|nr:MULTISPECIES: recombinase family protein [Priestia]MCU7712983.1 recombinase family protein [Priestia megaterium]MCW1049168.1 recombinase family protein [Priestia sp. JV24]